MSMKYRIEYFLYLFLIIYPSKSLLTLFPSSTCHYLLYRGLFSCKKKFEITQFIITSINILDIKQTQLHQATYINNWLLLVSHWQRGICEILYFTPKSGIVTLQKGKKSVCRYIYIYLYLCTSIYIYIDKDIHKTSLMLKVTKDPHPVNDQ